MIYDHQEKEGQQHASSMDTFTHKANSSNKHPKQQQLKPSNPTTYINPNPSIKHKNPKHNNPKKSYPSFEK